MSHEIVTEAARPMAFFPHDTNAAQDMKIECLLDGWGMAGYGMWWRLCEMLGATDGHRIEVGNPRVAKVIARNLMLPGVEELDEFVQELVDLELVELRDGFISSHRMDRNAEYFGKKRAAARKGGRARRAEE